MALIVAVSGLPGSGKSYFSSRLADAMEIRYLSSDAIRDEVQSETTYDERAKSDVYEELFKRAGATVKNGESVVVDATFHKRERREVIGSMADELGVPHFWIEIVAEEDVIRDRLSADREESDADFEVYKKLKHEADPLTENRLILTSTNDNIAEMLLRAMAYVNAL